uniref:Kelch-like protein diablo n=1 Tax=Clastoptera arizonana TaxID=38151 RepID=A0A1B6CM95_9HEMI
MTPKKYLLNTIKKRKRVPKKIRSKTNLNNFIYKKCLCCVELSEVLSVWNELQSKRMLCDGIVRTSDGELFYIHRIVLCSISKYFKAYFTDCLGGGLNEIKELKLDDVDSPSIKTIIDFAYTGKCKLTEENVFNIIPVADRFCCFGLLNFCWKFLLQKINPENCIGILKFSKHYFFCIEIQNKCWSYICGYFVEVYRTSKEFLQLTKQELSQILSDDRLNVNDEYLTFEAIQIWINFDPDKRKSDLKDLLKCVRFGYMNRNYFYKVVKLICYNEDTKEILDLAEIIVNLKHELKPIEVTSMTKPRLPFEVLFVIGGWTVDSPTSVIETYDIRSDQWLMNNNTDIIARAYHGVALLDNLIYIIGGFNGTEHFNSMRCYDPTTQTWTEKAYMHNARCYVSVCVLNGEIYALGGFNGYARLKSAEKYNPLTNQWEMLPSMNRPRSDANAVAFKDKIYIAGGFDGTDIMCSVEVYSLSTQQWVYVANMNQCRSGLGLLQHKGILYAIGGYNGNSRLNTVEKYHTDKRLWEYTNSMKTQRSNFASAVLRDKIYVIGGFNGSHTINSTECFDPNSHQWYILTDTKINRSAAVACVCKNLNNAEIYLYSYQAKLTEGKCNAEHQREITASGDDSI